MTTESIYYEKWWQSIYYIEKESKCSKIRKLIDAWQEVRIMRSTKLKVSGRLLRSLSIYILVAGRSSKWMKAYNRRTTYLDKVPAYGNLWIQCWHIHKKETVQDPQWFYTEIKPSSLLIDCWRMLFAVKGSQLVACHINYQVKNWYQ